MTYLWDKSFTFVGNNDPSVSPYLKAWIRQDNVCVVGVYGEDASKEFQVNWNSPFEEDTVGGYFQKVGGVVQHATGMTSKGTLSSVQIWEGNRPTAIHLPLTFYALSDAKKEVMDPIRALEKMLSPNVNKVSPGGKIPQTVSINIGRNAIYSDIVITGMTEPLGRPKTKEGFLAWADVILQVETLMMQNQSDIDNTFG